MIRLFSFLLLLLHFSPSFVLADDGVFQNRLVFGQTAVMEGSAGALGTGMREGILAAFKEVNDRGGINGRKLELISRDDGYEPDRAIANTKLLINEDKVFALIGGVGTPTANAILPIVTAARIPFIGPFTGAEFLRTPFQRYAVNIRASYWQETEEWIERLTKDLGITRIAILYQDDSYGLAGLSGVEQALKKRGLSLVSQNTYKRNTLAVKKAALITKESNPEAIVMVGTYKPCAEFIKLSKKLGVKAYYLNISFVGSEALAEELGTEGEGIIVSQVVPFPFDASVPLVKSYQTALKRYDPQAKYGFVSMEGYMTGRLALHVLTKMTGEITQESFLNALYKAENISLDGTTLTYNSMNNQGMNKVFLTQLNKNGRFVPITQLKKSK